jgi:hypothetical protein
VRIELERPVVVAEVARIQGDSVKKHHETSFMARFLLS